MFVGHYAPALALRARSEVPLWKLFVAVQAVDVLFFALVPLGVERLVIDPTRAGSLALVLPWMPWSHSLAAAVFWGASGALLTRSPAIGLAVASHWFLDLPMHLGDLPILAGDGPRVGLGLWTHPGLALAFEVGLLLIAGARLGGRRVLALCGVLALVQALQTFVVPLPPSADALAALSEASYALFAWMALKAESAPPLPPPPA